MSAVNARLDEAEICREAPKAGRPAVILPFEKIGEYHIERIPDADVHKPVYEACKRLCDVVLASLMLLVFALPMAVIALAVRGMSSGGALYAQTRLGKDGKPFLMYNLRCMELVRRLHEKLEHIRAYFCTIQTTNFHDPYFRHQNGVFPAVETG